MRMAAQPFGTRVLLGRAGSAGVPERESGLLTKLTSMVANIQVDRGAL